MSVHRANRSGSWRGLLGPGIATALLLVVLLGLGFWQLERLTWKQGLMAAIADRTTAEPVPLPAEAEWTGLESSAYAYRHVKVDGVFEHDKEVHVFRPLMEGKGPAHGLGYLVLTPLRLASGAVVIVNRGFVPDDRLDPSTRPAGQITGTVTVTGLMREAESRNFFTPADDVRNNMWFTRDPAAIAKALHLNRAATFSIDADAGAVPGGLPQGGETVLDLPNNHLSYAVTWFGLAIALLGVFGVYALRKLRGSYAPSASEPESRLT